jgi:hypothetical protein
MTDSHYYLQGFVPCYKTFVAGMEFGNWNGYHLLPNANGFYTIWDDGTHQKVRMVTEQNEGGVYEHPNVYVWAQPKEALVVESARWAYWILDAHTDVFKVHKATGLGVSNVCWTVDRLVRRDQVPGLSADDMISTLGTYIQGLMMNRALGLTLDLNDEASVITNMMRVGFVHDLSGGILQTTGFILTIKCELRMWWYKIINVSNAEIIQAPIILPKALCRLAVRIRRSRLAIRCCPHKRFCDEYKHEYKPIQLFDDSSQSTSLGGSFELTIDKGKALSA